MNTYVIVAGRPCIAIGVGGHQSLRSDDQLDLVKQANAAIELRDLLQRYTTQDTWNDELTAEAKALLAKIGGAS